MQRRKKLALNAVTALIKQFITIVCGFILPRYILTYYGSSVNGLIQSITQFLAFITFLEMGIGPVIQSNLYKPLAEKDDIKISQICASSERFFRRIAYVFLVYILVLFFVFPYFSNNNFGFVFTGSLILIISISSFAQYYFGITYQLLLNADQKSYIQLVLQSATIILNTAMSVVMIRIGCSIHLVKLVSSVIYVLRPLLMMFYVKKHYNINNKIKYDGEPIKQKWNGFAQHLASVVVSNTDVTVLTIFSTLENVSIYSVYYTVVRGITDAVMTVVTGLEALWGNMIAKKEWGLLHKTYEIVEWAVHVGVTLLFTVAAILIAPFVKVYTNGINDVNYYLPVFGMVLVASYGAQCLRVPYFRIIKAAGHYKQTQNASFVQMIINIIFSVLLVKKWGLLGVGVGTLLAMLYHTCYFAWYLTKNILNRNIKYFIGLILSDLIEAFLIVYSTKTFSLSKYTYVVWIIYAFKVSIIALIVGLVFNMLFYRKKCKQLVNIIIKKKA